MTKIRAEFIYQLTGTIQKRKTKKASPESKYAGQTYYDLLVKLEKPYQHIKIIQVFPNKLARKEILTTIESEEFQPKYQFLCRNQWGHFYLIDWEEVA